MHSGVDVEAFQAALNRDIGGDASTSQLSGSNQGTPLFFSSSFFWVLSNFFVFVAYYAIQIHCPVNQCLTILMSLFGLDFGRIAFEIIEDKRIDLWLGMMLKK